MTVIAYDGKSLAADKQLTDEQGFTYTSTKIHLVGGDRLGFVGHSGLSRMLLHWYKAGANPKTFPPALLSTQDTADLWVVKSDGRILCYGKYPEPIELADTTFTAGSGAALARGALAMGATAAQAVLIACEWDANCGRGVDVLDEAACAIRRAG